MVKKILIFLIPILIVVVYGFKPHDEPNNNSNNNGIYRIIPNQVAAAVDQKQLNANQISTWFRTNGSFNRNPVNTNSGFEWPKGSGKTARYASGLWLGCVVGNDTLTTVAEYSYDYLPGYVDNNGNAAGL
ncbi:MAG: hypothetical protein M3P82_00640, partial [Bacteroidota bacterium]|nr:hypothetical protein [Bacteroidota bacterium]